MDDLAARAMIGVSGGYADEALVARLLEARGILAGVTRRTPVVTSRTLDERVQARVFLKCENLQRGGSFKLRGAFHALARLDPATRARGVIAFSSGNHAQAVALAARHFGVPVVIVMPGDAPAPKLDATRGYGAEVVVYDRGTEDRVELTQRLARERGLALVPPFDHVDVLTGQGTAAAEQIEDAGPLDLLLTPVGGGGLLSGSALAVRAAGIECRAIGVEPAGGDDGVRSFRAGHLVRVEHPDTIADGARTPSLGEITFPIIQRNVADLVSVPDTALIEAMRFSFERLKLVMEPTGALGLAALLHGTVPVAGQRVGVIVSGGNLDLAAAREWFA